MNLHGIVSGAIAAINPVTIGSIQVSAPATTRPDGKRTPQYLPIQRVPMQVQALGFRDLQQLQGLNLQGIRRKIYINGKIDGLVRPDGKGGDLITIDEGDAKGVWLVAMVLEYWPDWCSVAVTQQNGA